MTEIKMSRKLQAKDFKDWDLDFNFDWVGQATERFDTVIDQTNQAIQKELTKLAPIIGNSLLEDSDVYLEHGSKPGVVSILVGGLNWVDPPLEMFIDFQEVVKRTHWGDQEESAAKWAACFRKLAEVVEATSKKQNS